MFVVVNGERVGAGDRGQVGDGRRHDGEPQGAAPLAAVAVQRRRLAAAGEVQLAAPVAVAVERGHAAADEVLEVTRILVVDDPRLLDEVRGGDCHGSGRLVASHDWYGNCEGDCDGAVAKSAHRSD